MKLFAAPDLERHRVYVLKGGEVIAVGDIDMLPAMSSAVAAADEVYMHPDAAHDFKAWLIKESAGRLN